jgi:hypothetical protein
MMTTRLGSIRRGAAASNVFTTVQISTVSLANLTSTQNSGNGGNKHESTESY